MVGPSLCLPLDMVPGCNVTHTKLPTPYHASCSWMVSSPLMATVRSASSTVPPGDMFLVLVMLGFALRMMVYPSPWLE